jgi:hypothetical protein
MVRQKRGRLRSYPTSNRGSPAICLTGLGDDTTQIRAALCQHCRLSHASRFKHDESVRSCKGRALMDLNLPLSSYLDGGLAQPVNSDTGHPPLNVPPVRFSPLPFPPVYQNASPNRNQFKKEYVREGTQCKMGE